MGKNGVCNRYIGRPLALTGLPGSSVIRRRREPFHSLLAADKGRKAEAGQSPCCALAEVLTHSGGKWQAWAEWGGDGGMEAGSALGRSRWENGERGRQEAVTRL